MTSKLRLLSIAGALCTITFIAGFFLAHWHEENTLPADIAKLQLSKDTLDLPAVPVEEAYPYQIPKSSTFFNALRALNVPPQTLQQIVDATKPVYNLARINSGVRFQLTYNSRKKDMTLEAAQLLVPGAQINEPEQELSGIEFYFSALDKLKIQKENSNWIAQKITEQVEIKTVTFSGNVSTSLWQSAVKAGMDPDLISELADIFGWEVDFAREVQINDRWRLTVEQKLVKNVPVGWGAILAAEYINSGEVHQAALFRNNGKDVGYFTPKGASLKKVFLKSPIRYGRITSTFKRSRFHPVLQIYRAHRGVDYGAPTGTPIRAVGDGTVTFAARSGGGGNIIKIRHNSTYETAYKHLSGYAKGIRSGARVQQGQVIGYVGSTGISTGPHLHFEFYQSGNYIDPLGKKFPSAEPIPAEHLATFNESAQKLLKALPNWSTDTKAISTREQGQGTPRPSTITN
ncbi:MAG: M23 family metallopeptidase [Bdellovibrionaceae bacterium]|nr:M23 family metallopeptidase [Pseudobdellovibrionaceae bacterium]